MLILYEILKEFSLSIELSLLLNYKMKCNYQVFNAHV